MVKGGIPTLASDAWALGCGAVCLRVSTDVFWKDGCFEVFFFFSTLYIYIYSIQMLYITWRLWSFSSRTLLKRLELVKWIFWSGLGLQEAICNPCILCVVIITRWFHIVMSMCYHMLHYFANFFTDFDILKYTLIALPWDEALTRSQVSTCPWTNSGEGC